MQTINMVGEYGNIDFQCEDAVATQVVADFVTTPTPAEQEYVGQHGSFGIGYTPSVVAINWINNHWCSVIATPVVDE